MQLGDRTLGPWASRDWMLVRPARLEEIDTIRSFKKEGQLLAANAVGCVVLRPQRPPSEVVEFRLQEQLEGQETECRLRGARPDAAGP